MFKYDLYISHKTKAREVIGMLSLSSEMRNSTAPFVMANFWKHVKRTEENSSDDANALLGFLLDTPSIIWTRHINLGNAKISPENIQKLIDVFYTNNQFPGRPFEEYCSSVETFRELNKSGEETEIFPNPKITAYHLNLEGLYIPLDQVLHSNIESLKLDTTIIEFERFHKEHLKKLPRLRELKLITMQGGEEQKLSLLPRQITILELENVEISKDSKFDDLPRGLAHLKIKSNLLRFSDFFNLPIHLKRLDLYKNNLRGEFKAKDFPEFLTHLNLGLNKFSGNLNVSELPYLIELHVQYNLFSGRLDTAILPRRLKELSISGNHFSGSFDVMGLPNILEKLSMNNCNFEGNFDVSKLPRNLKGLFIDSNNFSGVFDFTHLPRSLKQLLLHNNSFSGKVNLDNLPLLLEIIEIQDNNFEGNIDTKTLPRDLETFSAGNNNFSGNINIYKLPPQLKVLELSNNSFEGEIDFSKLPKLINVVALSGNKFSKSKNLGNLPDNITAFEISENNFEEKVEIISFPPLLRFYDISHNRFSGTIAFEELPENLATFDVSHNQFTGDIILRDTSTSLEILDLSNNKFGKEIILEEISGDFILNVKNNEIKTNIKIDNIENIEFLYNGNECKIASGYLHLNQT